MADHPRAVITGASSGIGAATAQVLAAQGYSLFLGARRVPRLDALRREIATVHPRLEVEVCQLDVTDPASARAFAERAGEVDVLVNCAGLARGQDPVVSADEQDWREMVETNVMGLARMTKLLLPGMMARRRGTVVMIGSVAALEPYPGGSVYGATKAGVKTISKALRHEVLGTGVRICNIEPGAVTTEFSLVRFHGDAARADAVYQGFTPLTPADVAEAIGFVVSRPPHVDIEELVLYPTAQAGTRHTHRA